MRTSVIALLLAMSATLSSGVQASSTRMLRTVWSARATNYRHQHDLAHAQLKSLALAAAVAVRDAKPTAPEDIAMFLGAIDEASGLAGRGRFVSAFLEFMSGKPEPAMIDRWMREQADILNARIDGFQAFEAQANKTIDYRAAPPSERLKALEAVVIEQGMLLGTLAEMTLINQILRIIPKL
jgi:hypothetical protein